MHGRHAEVPKPHKNAPCAPNRHKYSSCVSHAPNDPNCGATACAVTDGCPAVTFCNPKPARRRTCMSQACASVVLQPSPASTNTQNNSVCLLHPQQSRKSPALHHCQSHQDQSRKYPALQHCSTAALPVRPRTPLCLFPPPPPSLLLPPHNQCSRAMLDGLQCFTACMTTPPDGPWLLVLAT
jgi:hypothetical protein